MNPPKRKQISWDDLEYVAIIAQLNDSITQCVITLEGHQTAHLFLLRDGLLALTEVRFEKESEPADGLLLAIGRVLVAHLRACREGRILE
jgi:hypothetical protein